VRLKSPQLLIRRETYTTSGHSTRVRKSHLFPPDSGKADILLKLSRREFKLPAAGVVRMSFLSLAAGPVAFAITVAAAIALSWSGANGNPKEVTMETKTVHRKVVRTSVLQVIQGVGTAAIGGILAT